MQDVTLLKTQKNEVLEMILSVELQPDDFSWTTDDEVAGINEPRSVFSCLNHRLGYFFKFRKYNSTWSPGEAFSYVDERPENEDYLNWYHRVPHIVRWLHTVKREVNSPDLWNSLKKARSLQEPLVSSNVSNAQFTPEEQTSIAAQLEEIKRYIVESSQLQTEQFERLEGQFYYLIESSERLGRKDWYNILTSVLFSIVISGIFAPARAQELFQIAAAVFEPLLRSTQLFRAIM